MPDIATSDPFVVIEATGKRAGVFWLRYRREVAGVVDRWTVRGTCNQCGLCVIGAVPASRFTWSGPPGTPMAVTDVNYAARPDDPIAPGFIEDMVQMAALTPTATVAGCSLTIEPA